MVASLVLAIFMPAVVVVVLTKVLAMLVQAVALAVVAVVATLGEAALQFMAQLLGAVEQATVPAVVVLATALVVWEPTLGMAERAVLEYLAVVVVLVLIRERPVEMGQ
jgi:hypothetical protein